MRRIASLAFSIALFASAQRSQPPAPTPGKPTQENKYKASPEQTKAATDQKAANDFSLLVDKVSSEIARRDQQKSTAKGIQKAPIDWWAVGNTGFNTLFTGLLVLLMFHQWKVMGKALSETKRSIDMMVSKDRARINVSGIQILGLEQVYDPLQLFLSVVVSNDGHTSAYRVTVKMGTAISDRRDESKGTSVPMYDSFITPCIKPGDTEEFRFPVSHFSDSAIEMVKDGSRMLYVFGSVTYSNTFEQKWSVTAGRRLFVTFGMAQNWLLTNDPNENREKQEQT